MTIYIFLKEQYHRFVIWIKCYHIIYACHGRVYCLKVCKLKGIYGSQIYLLYNDTTGIGWRGVTETKYPPTRKLYYKNFFVLFAEKNVKKITKSPIIVIVSI